MLAENYDKCLERALRLIVKWQVQISTGKTQQCTLPRQLSDGVPFTATVEDDEELASGRELAKREELASGREPRRERLDDKRERTGEREAKSRREAGSAQSRCVRRGRQVLLLHDIGAGLCLEENLTLLAQERTPLSHGRCQVQVLYATRAGKVHSCQAEVGLAAVARSGQRVSAQASQASEVVSPLTGKIVKVLVAQDAKVRKGEALLIIEAMKMENVVQAEGNGVVVAVNTSVGAAVRSGDVLLSLRGEH